MEVWFIWNFSNKINFNKYVLIFYPFRFQIETSCYQNLWPILRTANESPHSLTIMVAFAVVISWHKRVKVGGQLQPQLEPHFIGTRALAVVCWCNISAKHTLLYHKCHIFSLRLDMMHVECPQATRNSFGAKCRVDTLRWRGCWWGAWRVEIIKSVKCWQPRRSPAGKKRKSNPSDPCIQMATCQQEIHKFACIGISVEPKNETRISH